MTETNTQRGWEERLKSLQFSQNGIICPSCRIQDFVCRHCIRDFIATELTKAREEGHAEMFDLKEKEMKSYRQELRKKVEQRIEALKTKELRGDGILVLEDLLTIISE